MRSLGIPAWLGARAACVLGTLGVLGVLGVLGPQPALGQPISPARAPELAARSGEDAASGSLPEPKLRYVLDGIEVRGNTRTSRRVILQLVDFRAGDVLDVDDPDLVLTRYRLLGTGFFSSVHLSLRKGGRRGAAVLVVEVVERNTLVVEDLWVGIAADEDTAGNAEPLAPYVGAQIAERNLAGTGITLGAGVGVAADQLALRTRFAAPRVAGTAWTLTGSLLYSDARDFFGSRDVLFESPDLGARAVTDYAVVAYRRSGGSLGAGLDVGSLSRLHAHYRLEQVDAVVPTFASHLRGTRREPIDFDVLPGKSVLSALGGAIDHDARDAPFLTRRGSRLRAAVTAGLPPIGSDYGFAKLEAQASRWILLPWRHVLRLEAYAGAVLGESPFFEQFYIGDLTDLLPDRILELAPDRRQPPNFLGTDIVEVRYGHFAARLEGEYRVPLYAGRGSVYGVEFFVSAGVLGLASRREIQDPPDGYEGAELVPVDLTYNLGLRVDTNVGGLRIAFSNLLGFLPARGGGRK